MRLPLVDALKAAASQFIVLHHLAAYGPISAAVGEAAPDFIAWMYEYARMAVQVFLVIGGYLAARGLAPAGTPIAGSPIALIADRYRRLILPYSVALVLAVVSAALARRWLIDEAIPNSPSWDQVLAHLLLLHSLLDYESLSAGVWYVAIDLQLFALLVGLLWLGRRRHWAAILVAATAAASLFWFNRDENLDGWALYFFGAYGMGVVAYWSGRWPRPRAALGLLAAIVLAALIVEFRERIAIALVVALALAAAGGGEGGAQRTAVVEYLGRISYALFLVHFPICLIANAAFVRLGFAGPTAAAVAMVMAWAASLAVAGLFHRWVELPSAQWLRLRPLR